MPKANSYENAIREILLLEKFGSMLGLSRIKRMLLLLGEPQKNYRCMVVGGSNGKGSTAEMIGSALCEAGFSAGTYFSPHIVEFPERIRVDGRNASKKEIADAYFEVKRKCLSKVPGATLFEVITACAFVIFSRRKVDFAVLEVGLGGRLDAVNACEPEISALTSLSLEHTEILGNAVGEIAHEKCGIARKGKLLVCGIMGRGERTAVLRECREIGALPVFAGREIRISHVMEKGLVHSMMVEFGKKDYHFSLSTPGSAQVSNAAVAAAVCSSLGIGKSAIEHGISNAKVPYRMQTVLQSPKVILDCAHNPEAAKVLAGDAGKIKAARKVLLFAAMRDKDYEAVLSHLGSRFDSVVLTELGLERSEKAENLLKSAMHIKTRAICMENPHLAFHFAKKLAGRDGLVVVAGSIYLLNELFRKDNVRLSQ